MWEQPVIHLGVDQDAHGRAVLLDLLQVLFNLLLTDGVFPLLCIFGESLLFRLVPETIPVHKVLLTSDKADVQLVIDHLKTESVNVKKSIKLTVVC